MFSILERCFKKSIWVYHTNASACNGCDIEIINALTPFYDAERFGIKLVGSPRHADALLVTGAVSRQVCPRLKTLYEAVAESKIIFAIGSCATGGGIWFDSYNIVGGVDKIIPVNFYIPGCPPRPEAILFGVALALGLVDKKVAAEYLKEKGFPELIEVGQRVTDNE